MLKEKNLCNQIIDGKLIWDTLAGNVLDATWTTLTIDEDIYSHTPLNERPLNENAV